MNYAIIYQDNSISIFNAESNTPITHNFGHFKQIDSIKFLPNNTSTFLTCSKDMSIYYWKHSGDRWTFTFFDLPRLIDSSLRYFRLSSEKQPEIKPAKSQNLLTSSISTKPGFSLAALAITMQGKNGILACGSNKGSIWIFDLFTGNLLMQRDVAAMKIVCMQFSPTGSHLLIAYSSGLINLYRFSGDLEFELQLEEPIITTEPISGNIYISAILTQLETNESSISSKSVSFDKVFSCYSTHNFATVRLHKILTYSGKTTKDIVCDYFIDEGKISGFDLHPSGEYIVIVSDAGWLFVYHTHMAQLRGKVKIGPSPYNCKIDPSGLYVFLLCSSNADEIPAPNKLHKRIMQVWELGTGGISTELSNMFDISTYEISKDGKYLILCSNKGVASVWAISGDIQENMQQVLDCMAANPHFWKNFPIDLRKLEVAYSKTENKIEEKSIPEPIENQEILRTTMGFPVLQEEHKIGTKLEEKISTKPTEIMQPVTKTIQKHDKNESFEKFERKTTFKGIAPSSYGNREVKLQDPIYSMQYNMPIPKGNIQPDPSDIDRDSLSLESQRITPPPNQENASLMQNTQKGKSPILIKERYPGLF